MFPVAHKVLPHCLPLPHLFALPFPSLPPATLSSLMFSKDTRPSPVSGPLHWLCPCVEHPSQIPSWLTPSISSLLRGHVLHKALPDSLLGPARCVLASTCCPGHTLVSRTSFTELLTYLAGHPCSPAEAGLWALCSWPRARHASLPRNGPWSGLRQPTPQAPTQHSPLQGEAPGDDRHILREPHGQQHLGAEDPRVPHFYPLLQACGGGTQKTGMCGGLSLAVSWASRPWAGSVGEPGSARGTWVIAEHFHAGLSVRVVGRLEAQLGETCGGGRRAGDRALSGGPQHQQASRLLTQLGEELPQDTHEVAQGEAVVSHDALDLVELG